MSLQNLQHEWVDALLDASANHYLGIKPASHLLIYQQKIHATLTHALSKTYPLVEALIGRDFFQLTAKEYIKRYPSRNHQLNDYGSYFSDFLAEYEPLHDLIYLVEVAQFEWICHTLQKAPKHPGITAAALTNVFPNQYPQLYFTLHPASHLQRFYYPILDIADFCRAPNDRPIFDVDAGGVNLFIFRSEETLKTVALSHAEFTFLDMLAEGKSTAESANTALMIDTHFNVKKTLEHWISEKGLVSFEVKS